MRASSSIGQSTYLGERKRVELVLGSKLKTAGLLCLHIVASLGTNLDGGVDLLVVACGDESQVLGADNAGDVARGLVAETKRVAGDSSLLDIVASLTTDEETVRAGDNVDDGIDVALGGAVVDECAGVDVGVLESGVDLLRGRALLGWVPEVLKINLDAWSDNIGELNFAVEKRRGRPCLSDGDTLTFVCQPKFSFSSSSTRYPVGEQISTGLQRCREWCHECDTAQKASRILGLLLSWLLLRFDFLFARCWRWWDCCGF